MDILMTKDDILTEEVILNTPWAALSFIQKQEATIQSLLKRIENLEAKIGENSSNSNRPPSSDNPFQKKSEKKQAAKKRGPKVGHQGHRQQLMPPTQSFDLMPDPCSCGNDQSADVEQYYTHQVLELPEHKVDVIHFRLFRGVCRCCNRMNKALVPMENRTGYGPRLSAMIAEMAGTQADSLRIVQNFCASVWGFHISLGAVQRVIDRVSQAIEPHYDAIGEAVRSQEVNNVDETSWRKNGALRWLWIMGNTVAAYFMVHGSRSKAAFSSLIRDWQGILVSDGYNVYQKWVGKRQACLVHLIRTAKGLSERKDKEISRFGTWATEELRRLCKMANAPPTKGEWGMFYARFIRLITRHRDRKDDAGKFARRLEREMAHLWVFLEEGKAVPPTNNHAERLLRFAVQWRKSSFGSASEKGERWTERILSLRQTCRLRGKRTYVVLVDAVTSYFHGQKPDTQWIRQGLN